MTVRSPLITADPTPSAGQGHKRTRRPRHPYAPKPHDLGATADEMLAVLVKAFPDRGPSGIDWRAIPAESRHGPALALGGM